MEIHSYAALSGRVDPQSSSAAPHDPTAFEQVPTLWYGGMLRRAGTRADRLARDAWDIVRWARCPFEIARAALPVPKRWRDVRVLNEGEVTDKTGSAAALGAALGVLRNVLQSEAMATGRVDYATLPDCAAYSELRERSRLLARILPESFRSDAERTAFWLNVYNVLSIHGVVAFGIRRSVMEVPSFFVRAAYRVGPHIFTLDDISNGILRRGARKPSTGRAQFRPDDARTAYWSRAVDPRIHGALVCAAASCPPVALYDAQRLDEQLDIAAGNLVSQYVRVDQSRRRIRLPLQFYYYARDFGGPTGVTKFVLRYVPETDLPLVRQALRERWRVAWDRYNWALNAQG
jgi:hypothetical protein